MISATVSNIGTATQLRLILSPFLSRKLSLERTRHSLFGFVLALVGPKRQLEAGSGTDSASQSRPREAL